MEEKNLSVLHLRIALFQADPSISYGLDLAPEQRNPRFERFEKFVVEESFFIFGYDFSLRFFSHSRRFSSPKRGAWLDNTTRNEEQKENNQESTWVIPSSKQLESNSRT